MYIINHYIKPVNASLLQAWTLSYYDAILVYAEAMHEMLEVDKHTLDIESMSCKQIPASPWKTGERVMQYLKQVSQAAPKMPWS